MGKLARMFACFYFILISLACDSGVMPVATEQQVLFQVAYRNFAWGERNSGFFIDSQGRILRYDNPETWHFFDEKAVLTSAQMEENLEQTELNPLKVSLPELKQFSDKIQLIKGSDFSQRKSVGNDMGAVRYYALVFNKTEKSYSPVLLAETGDFEIYRKDPSAIEIRVWLEEIQTKLY